MSQAKVVLENSCLTWFELSCLCALLLVVAALLTLFAFTGDCDGLSRILSCGNSGMDPPRVRTAVLPLTLPPPVVEPAQLRLRFPGPTPGPEEWFPKAKLEINEREYEYSTCACGCTFDSSLEKTFTRILHLLHRHLRVPSEGR